VSGQVAVADIKKGQLVARQQFRLATPPPPRMAVTSIRRHPGRRPGARSGSKIDLVAVTQAGQPLWSPAWSCSRPRQRERPLARGKQPPSGIDVAVPDELTAQKILAATSGGKFAIRVTGTPGTG